MSTGLNCEIVRRIDGGWYYVLENWDAPQMAWDWMEHATAYGPFPTEEAATRHLGENHANPGGWTVYRMQEGDENETYATLFEEAVSPESMRRLRRYGSRSSFYGY